MKQNKQNLVNLANKLDTLGRFEEANKIDSMLRRAARSGYWSFDDTGVSDDDYDKAHDQWEKMAKATHAEFEKKLKSAVDQIEKADRAFIDKVNANESEKDIDEVNNYINSPLWYADHRVHDVIRRADVILDDGMFREDFADLPGKIQKSMDEYRKLFGNKYDTELALLDHSLKYLYQVIDTLPKKSDPPMKWKLVGYEPKEQEAPGQNKLF